MTEIKIHPPSVTDEDQDSAVVSQVPENMAQEGAPGSQEGAPGSHCGEHLYKIQERKSSTVLKKQRQEQESPGRTKQNLKQLPN